MSAQLALDEDDIADIKTILKKHNVNFFHELVTDFDGNVKKAIFNDVSIQCVGEEGEQYYIQVN